MSEGFQQAMEPACITRSFQSHDCGNGKLRVETTHVANRRSEYGRENQLRDKLTWAPPAWLHAKRFKHDPREHNICPGTEAPASCHHPYKPRDDWIRAKAPFA